MTTRPRLTPEQLLSRSKLPALAEGTRIWLLDEGESPDYVTRYAAPSATTPGIAHEVIVHGRDILDVTCSCPSGSYRGACKHVGAVLLLMDAREEADEIERATQATVLTPGVAAGVAEAVEAANQTA